MSESFIEPDSLNTTFQSISAIVDDSGATRFLNSELSSYNFNGFIPNETDTIPVNELEPGMSFLPPSASVGTLRTVLKVEFDDPEMTDSPTSDYIISYLGDNGDITTVTYDSTDQVEVYFEDWENKVLGDAGWIITQAGNAIFSNVAVRGRIEATEGFLENLDITGVLSVDSGGSIEIGNSPGTGTNPGIVIDSSGIFSYDNSGSNTLTIDAATGEIIINGTSAEGLVTEDGISDSGTTIISANRITTGSVTGRVIRSNSSMSPTSGTGIYLDGDGNVRFGNSNATLTFTSSGLNISGAGVTIGGTNPDNFITGGEVDGNITQIDGGKITTGIIESFDFNGIANGLNYSSDGTAINLLDGSITSKNFRIDTSGNAYFAGSMTVDSIFSNSTGNVSVSRNAITASAASIFPAVSLSFDYLGSIESDGFLGYALIEANPGIALKATSSSRPLILQSNSGDVYVTPGSSNRTYITNPWLLGTITGAGNPVVVSTSGPSSPASYSDNTVWYVI